MRRALCRRVLVCSLGLFVIAPAVRAQCPVSQALCRGWDSSNNLVFEFAATTAADTASVAYNDSRASFNHPDGVFEAFTQVDEVFRHSTHVTATDRYVLQGVPAAQVTVRLNLLLYVITDPSGRMAWASAAARLTGGVQAAEAQSLGPGIDPYIEVVVWVLEGEPFEVTCEVSADGSGYYPICRLTGTLEFADLPDGAQITSCNGFGDLSVPVEATTWGAVKSLYR